MNSEQTGGDGTRYDGRRAGRNLAEPNPYLQILFTDCSGTVEMFSAVQEATLKPSWAEEQFRFFLSDSEDAASMQVCMYILLLVRPPVVARVFAARSITISYIAVGQRRECGDERGRVGVLY